MTEDPIPDVAAPARTPWQRHVIDPIAAQLTQGITPEKIALTLAVGSALALFPIFGMTTILCLIVGIALRLNQPIIQIVNALCTPIHLPVIIGMVRLGSLIFKKTYYHIRIQDMNQLFWANPVDFIERFGMTALHAIVAWAIVAPFWSVLVYIFALPVLREVHRRRVAIVTQTVPTPPPEHPVP